MKRLARALAVSAGLLILGSLISLVPQKSVTAQGGPVVTIAGPLPLPVKGTVAASKAAPGASALRLTQPSASAATCPWQIPSAHPEADSDHLSGGIVLSLLPPPTLLMSAGPVVTWDVVLHGYVVP
jgi:hypothetical protein